jgi:hypothetical protein
MWYIVDEIEWWLLIPSQSNADLDDHGQRRRDGKNFSSVSERHNLHWREIILRCSQIDDEAVAAIALSLVGRPFSCTL